MAGAPGGVNLPQRNGEMRLTVTVQAAGKPRGVASMIAKGGQIIGGGTLLVGDLNYGKLDGTTLISLDNLGLSQITVAGKKVKLGAMVTMAAIAREVGLAFLHPVANAIGGPAIRSMATVGGNLFAPPPYGDMAAALLALDATVTLSAGQNTSILPLTEFLTERGKMAKLVVIGVSFQRPAEGEFRFLKVIRRKPVSAAVITIAARIPLKRGRVAGARIALGGMAPTAIRAIAVEAALEGQKLDAETIRSAVASATDGTSPEDDAYASAWYRREILPVHLSRLLAGSSS
ncbi:FAD binding domain-containing protein [soil metagenome]